MLGATIGWCCCHSKTHPAGLFRTDKHPAGPPHQDLPASVPLQRNADTRQRCAQRCPRRTPTAPVSDGRVVRHGVLSCSVRWSTYTEPTAQSAHRRPAHGPQRRMRSRHAEHPHTLSLKSHPAPRRRPQLQAPTNSLRGRTLSRRRGSARSQRLRKRSQTLG